MLRAAVSPAAPLPAGLLLAPAVALLGVILTHWKGMSLTADGWAMWQGAASLATGQGFSYFSGHPIAAWPPLYPLYLALWTLVLGPSGLSLVVSHGTLIALQAYLWAWLFRRIADDSALPVTLAAQLLLSTFLGLFLCQSQPTILAHTLVYTLLPLLLWALWRLMAPRVSRQVSPPTPRSLPPPERASLALGIVVGALLLLSHNAAIVFVAAGAAIVALRWPPSRRSIAGAAALFAVPFLVWTLTRYGFGQAGSHRFGWGVGRFGPATYLGQLVSGVGDLLLPPRSVAKFAALPLLLAAAAVLYATGRERGLRLGVGFVLQAALFTVALFTLTFVSNPLSGARFIGFIPLILVPLVFQSADRGWPRTARAALIALIALQAYWIVLGARNMWLRSPTELGFVQDWEETRFVPLDAHIDRSYRGRPPVRTDTGFLVAPPSFEETPGRRD
ncbi:hypothetical protein BH11PSE3_BH11PSE3_49640 [soil metagenome]